jgi:predicted phosphodiesterase
MKALFISDEKPKEPLSELTAGCEIVILLGDLFYEWIEELKDIDIPIIAVRGNYDFGLHINS